MIKITIPAIVVSVLWSCSWSLLAAESATEKLHHFIKTITTFQANFSQTVFDPQGKVIEQGQGQFILQRPGKFRWDYQQPYPHSIVADGEHIWFYDVDLEQVTVKSQSAALLNTPATLLSDNIKPEDKYLLTELASNDGLLWLELNPKDSESQFQTISLAFAEAGLQQMVIKDSFDRQTRLVFSQAIENPSLAAERFTFTPPAGVDIVGDLGL